MKYLIVLVVVMVAVWFWRQNRRPPREDRNVRAARQTGAPQAMARCAHCGVHLPIADAVAGGRGTYCSAAHLQLAESQPPS